eukprot:TRINITY_DN9486_c0_g1_i2.p1 TRINITY_DN9486_c0_g1~~TRINITY_DN9486_c0_g1_i2.p1  ORF type:complete len:546 (-),score=73.68 TRINITY_DN9486_c0_g1_i2:36-1673(-)
MPSGLTYTELEEVQRKSDLISQILLAREIIQQQKQELLKLSQSRNSSPALNQIHSAMIPLNTTDYPFCNSMVTCGTMRPNPAFLIHDGLIMKTLLIKAEPTPGYNFKLHNHLAYYSSKPCILEKIYKGKFIVFDDLRVSGVGAVEGHEIRIDFCLYSIDSQGTTLLARITSPPVMVFARFHPNMNSPKIFPNFAVIGASPTQTQRVLIFPQDPIPKGKSFELELSDNHHKKGFIIYSDRYECDVKCDLLSLNISDRSQPIGHVFIKWRSEDRNFSPGSPFFFLEPPTLLQTRLGYHHRFETEFLLFVGSYLGHIESVMKALHSMENPRSFVNTTDFNGCTALWWACFQGHIDIVKILIRYGAQINSSNHYGHTPLHAAAFKSQEKVISALVANEVDVEKQDCEGATALHIAAAKGDVPITLILLNEMETILSVDKDKMTPLHYAAMTGHAKSFKCIAEASLAHGEDIDSTDIYGFTPLRYAVNNSSEDIVTYICDFMDVDVNRQDLNEETHLGQAVKLGNLNIVNTLLKRGAKRNVCNRLGESTI